MQSKIKINNTKLVLIFISAFALSGCCSLFPKMCKQVVCETKTVYLPVYKPVEPAKVTRPELPIDSLTKESSDEEIAKAYVATIEILRSYSKQLEIAIDPFQKAWDNREKDGN